MAGFKKDGPHPAHAVTRWQMGNALRRRADADYVAAGSQENALMAFHEAAYEAACGSASRTSTAIMAYECR